MRRVAIVGNIIILIISVLLYFFQVLVPLDRSVLSFNMTKTMSHQPDEKIIVVGIDEVSMEAIGRYPWDRSIYAPLIENINQPGNEAKVIAFDILFTSESNPQSDAIFSDALSHYDNIILPVMANLENTFSRTTTLKKDELIKATHVEKPIPILAESAELAHINAILDSDGAIRRTWLQLGSPEGELPSLAYKTAEMAGAEVEHFLDYHPQTEIMIDYQATSYDYMTVPFISVLNGEFPLENFKDSIVLVGFTAVGFENDNGVTPVEKEMKLVYAQANIVNQLLNDRHISTPPGWITLLLIVGLAALTIFFTWRLKTISSILVLFAMISVMLVGQFFLYKNGSIYLDTIHPIAAISLFYLSNISIKSFFETKQKNFITKQFGRYISPDLVKEIAGSDKDIRLGGINKELSILFLDIRGFTTLSEKMQPEEVVDFLNMMFNLITEKALENNGTIDKFIGDAAMIVFNAPLDLENHEYFAVKTAYDIQKGMEEVRERINEKYEVEISVGIGINTGEAVIGNIGSYLRVDYTAIGDNVNIAARIESQTVAHQILVSETTYEKTKDFFTYEKAGEHVMKGKTVPIKLYELNGFKKIEKET